MKTAKKKALLQMEAKKAKKNAKNNGGGAASGKDAAGKPLGPEYYKKLLTIEIDKPKVDQDKLDSAKVFTSRKPTTPWPELTVARQDRLQREGPVIRVAPKKASASTDAGR